MYRFGNACLPSHLTDCPWCALDNQGVIYFIDLGEEVITTGGDFVLARVWAMVMASVAPPALQLPLPDHFGLLAGCFLQACYGANTSF